MKYIFLLVFLIVSNSIYSNELKKYEFTQQDGDLIIAFTLDDNAKSEIFNLKEPFRLILTIKGAGLGKNIKAKNKINNDIIKNIMAIQFKRNGKKNSKVIITLKKEVAYTIDTFNNRILLILKNIKSVKNDKIAQKILKNEKKIEKTLVKAELKNTVTKLDYQYIDEDLVFSIKTNKEANFKSFELLEPFRIFIDIDNVVLSDIMKKEIKYNDEYLQKVNLNEMSRNGAHKVRVSLMFKSKKPYVIEKFRNNIIITVKGAKKIKRIIEAPKIVKNEKKKVEIKKKYSSKKDSIVNFSYNDNSLLIAIKMREDAQIKSYNLDKPFRVVIDAEDTFFFNQKIKNFDYNDDYLKNIKFIKYQKNGKINSKVILLFNKYAPFEVDKINKTILITLSNVVRVNKDLSKNTESNNNLIEGNNDLTESNNDLTESNNDLTEGNNDLTESNNDLTESNNDLTIETSKKEKPKEIISKNKDSIVNFTYNDKSLLIAIKMRENAQIKNYSLTKPFRIIINAEDTFFFNQKMKNFDYNDDYLKNIKFIKYQKNGKINSKVILLFNKYAPFEVDKINKTILITLSNVVRVNKDLSKNTESNNDLTESNNDLTESNNDLTEGNNDLTESNNDLTIETSKKEKPEEIISFKKKRRSYSKNNVDNSLKLNEENNRANNNIHLSNNKHNIIRKIIFRKNNNKAMVIIKTSNVAGYQTELDGNIFSIIFPNSSFESRMTSLTLNTEFFRTNVKRIKPKRRGKTIIIKFFLLKSEDPEIEQDKNELYLKF